jgi:hypothetical protein
LKSKSNACCFYGKPPHFFSTKFSRNLPFWFYSILPFLVD